MIRLIKCNECGLTFTTSRTIKTIPCPDCLNNINNDKYINKYKNKKTPLLTESIALIINKKLKDLE